MALTVLYVPRSLDGGRNVESGVERAGDSGAMSGEIRSCRTRYVLISKNLFLN